MKSRAFGILIGLILLVGGSSDVPVAGDWNGDGALDIAVADGEESVLYEGRTTGRGWLALRLTGSAGQGSARGSQVRVVTGETSQYREAGLAQGYCSTGPTVLHVGLGDADSVSEIEVLSPDGVRTVLGEAPANRRLIVEHPKKETAVQYMGSTGEREGPVLRLDHRQPGQHARGRHGEGPVNG